MVSASCRQLGIIPPPLAKTTPPPEALRDEPHETGAKWTGLMGSSTSLPQN